MSVESEDYLDRFETSGTDEFTITFPVQYDAGGNAKDIKVYYRNSAGLEDDITDDCTIAGLVVTTPSAYAATTPASIVTLLRYPDLKQLSVYTSGSKFPASQFQSDIDRLMFVAQRLDSKISRGLRTPVTDDDVDLTLPNKDERASTVLGFDATGAPMASAGIPSVPATAYMATLLDDVDADEALATLFPATLETASKESVLTAVDFIYYSKLYRHEIGEYFYMQSRKATTAWAPATPTTFFPAVEVTTAAQVFDVANYPDYVPYLRAIGIEVGGVSTFAGTAAASVITLDNNATNLALLAALAEDTLFHGGYTDWRTVTWDGTDYAITNVDAVARTITVTGTPTAGAGTAIFYSYRIAGSTTTARLHKADGLVLATAGASGRVAGLRTRDQLQGHWHNYDNYGAGGAALYLTTPTANGQPGVGTAHIKNPITDGTNGAPRTGANTKDRSLAGYLYVHVGRYVA